MLAKNRLAAVPILLLLAGSAGLAEDAPAEPARRCAEHLRSTHGLELDAAQRACLERALAAAPASEAEVPKDCEARATGCEVGRAHVVSQVTRKYRLEAVTKSLGLDLASDIDTTMACVARDGGRVSLYNAVHKWDNLFKVHCPGLDLLDRISEAQLERCKKTLGASDGEAMLADPARVRCLDRRIYERYSENGELTEGGACKTVLVKDCGA